MSAPPFSKEWPHAAREIADAVSTAFEHARMRGRAELRTLRVVRRRKFAGITELAWKLAVGIVAILIPAALMSLLSSSLPVTTPGVVLLIAVAGSAYFVDWAGGITSLGIAALVLNLLFVGDRTDIGFPSRGDELTGLVVTILGGAALVWLIQRIKSESMADRLAAVAARAAAAALASIEAAAASHASGSSADRDQLHHALLRAMVSFNRAHVGVLLLSDPDSGELSAAATYGLDQIADHIVSPVDVAGGLIADVATQRRIRSIADLAVDKRNPASLLRTANVRSLIAVPLVDDDEQLLGIAVVGLLVAHRFAPTEIARIEALGLRASAMLQAAVGIDERETLLHTATQAQRWLEMVIAAMPEAVVLAVPPEGRVVAENQAAVERFGRLSSPDDDGDITKLLFSPDGDPLRDEDCPIQRAFQCGEVISGVELVAHKPGGGTMPVLVSAAPVRENDGPVVAVVAVFRDIAALKEASRLKDEFVSVVSHELRSPLTPIRGFVQLVARDLAREGGHDPQVSRLTSIAGHVDRMTRLVDDLLDVSSLKSGSLEIRPEAIDLGGLCEDVIRDRSSTVTSHTFEFRAPTESVVGDWDGDRLYQVIDNLVGNAVKYSPPGGTVTVSAGVDLSDGAATVTVADDGPGIAATDRERIFSAFYRSSEAAASQIAGLGLGLYICWELVAAHGGRIEVADVPGGGAAFTVRLPRITQAIAA